MRRDVFQGIADPTRREILNMVAQQPLNINALSGNFDVTRAAIYKHIKILIECGLIEVTQKGRERYCEANLQQLSQVSDWVEQYRQIWESRFDSLERYLAEIQRTDQTQKQLKNKKKNHGKK